LTQNDKLRLFNDHLARIGDKRQSALNQLFAANCPKLDTTYEEVYPKIVDDFAVKRLGLEGDALEERFRVWKRGQEAQARQDFDAMLGESAFVDFWGRMRKAKLDEGALAVAEDEREEGEGAGDGGAASLVDMAKHIDLKEIHSVLRVRCCFHCLAC
jgi:transcription elongation regulator 1